MFSSEHEAKSVVGRLCGAVGGADIPLVGLDKTLIHYVAVQTTKNINHKR